MKTPFSKNQRSVAQAHGAIACVIAALSTGCEQRSPTIDFVVPVNFRGAFVVEEDRTSGQAIAPVNDQIRLLVPPTGIVRVRDRRVLAKWHKLTARFADGNPIPVDFGFGDLPARDNTSAIMLAECGADESRHWYVVGSPVQVRYFAKHTGELFEYAPENGRPLPSDPSAP